MDPSTSQKDILGPKLYPFRAFLAADPSIHRVICVSQYQSSTTIHTWKPNMVPENRPGPQKERNIFQFSCFKHVVLETVLSTKT